MIKVKKESLQTTKRETRGKFRLTDGSTTRFRVYQRDDGRWAVEQWGNTPFNMSVTVPRVNELVQQRREGLAGGAQP